jgi:NADH-quinone oxidoreductase subunit E
MNPENVDKIIDSYNRDKSMLISILHDIEDTYNYLPKTALEQVADRLALPMNQIYCVATFFKAFHLTPRGKHLISICLGTACHVRGGPRVLEAIERKLSIKAGETTNDLAFTLERVNCLGSCALGPVVVIDKKYFANMNPTKTLLLLKKYKKF